MRGFTDLNYQYKKLFRGIEKLKDKDKIIYALNLSKKAHQGQKRDEGQDYFIHPLRVANCLIFELNIRDSDLLIAAILHDVVEDSDISLDEIKEKFGASISKLVGNLTRDKDKETKQQKFQKTMKASKEIRLLKSVDWLDNLRSFLLRKDRGERFFRHRREALEMYIPLAESVNQYIASEMKKVIKTLPKQSLD